MEIKFPDTEFFNFTLETIPKKLEHNFGRLGAELVLTLVIANIEVSWAILPFALFTIELFYRVLLKSKLANLENITHSPRKRD